MEVGLMMNYLSAKGGSFFYSNKIKSMTSVESSLLIYASETSTQWRQHWHLHKCMASRL